MLPRPHAHTYIYYRKQNSGEAFACFIDFRKAFVSVDRDLLWRKLETRYNLGGKFLGAFRALYKEVSCSIDINRDLTDWFEVNSGVP